VFVIFLVYCIVSLFSCACVFSPALRDIFHTAVARYSLLVLKVSLNTNKPNQTTPGGLWGISLTWNDQWRNRRVKQETDVVCLVECTGEAD